VREALRFNAVMRQPSRVNRKEKLVYVEEIIKLLGMEAYADAIVGVPGDGKSPKISGKPLLSYVQGLNIEQRKKLTIGVELAARPQLLLFLDEPSSGLDSQTSWSILNLLEKLTSQGQAILCTIHQPSAALFQRFDRLLFLGLEGKTVYLGEIGQDSSSIINYFERNGAKPCPVDTNPAEWIMETIGCTPGSHSHINWPEVWRHSPAFTRVHRELEEMESKLKRNSTVKGADKSDFREFAAPFIVQLWECFKRVNSQYWRTPSYLYSKTALSVLAVCSGLQNYLRDWIFDICRLYFLDFPSTTQKTAFKDFRIKHSGFSCFCT
jgi:ATP-binding cassette subfamily G (WHITE) protein 2 (PDR)